MAEVYEAIDTRSGQNVALKLLLPEIAADDSVKRRFLREASVGMEINHPGIVKVFDVGETGGELYMAMELVAGTTLEQVIQKKSLDIQQSIDLGLQIANALTAAHKKKIIHRDLKPRNIMVTGTGIKIMDFGLARVLDTSSITAEHEIIGTLYYMSPEQAIGAHVDERSDIFSLGVVLYQMITNRLPFQGEHPGAVIHAILYSDPMRFHELGLRVPVECEIVLFKTLKKKPQVRYNNASDLHSDLEKVRAVLQGRFIPLSTTEEVFEESPRGVYSELIGREQEMIELDVLLEKMIKGESSTIFVSGEAGIGKSRLVWELGQKAKVKQVRYMMGRCLFGEKGAPYQPVFEIIRSYFKLKNINDSKGLGCFIEDIMPHLTARRSIIESMLLIRPSQDLLLVNQEQLWDTVAELLKIIARERPVILHFDDVHWADEATLNLLVYVSRVLHDARMLIIGTYRTEELLPKEQGIPHPLQSMLTVMLKDRLASTINLGRLDKSCTKRVIDSVYKNTKFPENFADSVFRETEGNPLFILEALKLMQDEKVIEKSDVGWKINSDITKIKMPRRINDVINVRLRRLNKEEKNILDIAAVEGYTFHSDTICHIMGMPRLRVLRHLQDLETSHLLVHALAHEYQFDHGKIQETIYNSLIPELRREYHDLMAKFLIDAHTDNDEYTGEISRHYIAAEKNVQALPYLLKAGGLAHRLYANEKALDYIQQGLDIIRKRSGLGSDTDLQKMEIDLLKKRAEIRQYLAQYDEALDDYIIIEKCARTLNDKHCVVDAMTKQGALFLIKAKYKKAMVLFNDALSLENRLEGNKNEAQILHGIAAVYLYTGQFDDALKYYKKALAKQETINDIKGEVITLLSMSYLYFNIGEFDKMVAVCNKALKICEEADNKEGMANALHMLGSAYYSKGYIRMGIELTEKGLQINRQIGNKPGECKCIRALGMHHYTLGEYDMASQCFQKALEINKQVWIKSYFFIYNGIAEVASARGDFKKALAYYQKARDSQKQVAEICYTGYTLNNIAVVYYFLGDYERALDYLEQAKAFHARFGFSWAFGFTYAFSFMLWASLDASKKMWRNLKDLKDLNEKVKARRADVWIFMKEGYFNYTKGHYDKAYELVKQGLKISTEEVGEAYFTAESLILLAKIEIARQNLQRAHDLIREALDYTIALGRKHDIARAYLLCAQYYFLRKDFSNAKLHAERSLVYAEKCGMKEVIWQGRHMLAKVYLKEKKEKRAKEEFLKAKKTLDAIIVNLGDELKDIYLKREGVVDFQKDLKKIR